jgi:FkbM family methyltransferase
MYIVTSWHDYPAAILGYTERSLLHWFANNVKQGETWLDIGAHYGYTAIALSLLVGKQGRVYTFEPMISTAGYITQTRKINNLSQLTVVPLGLGTPKNDIMLHSLPTTRGMVDSTLNKNTGTWQETFVVTQLDWLWQGFCGTYNHIHGIKIDVQGMEIEVLRGMTNLLATHHPKLVVEVHSGVDRAELLTLLESVGYACEGIPVEPDASRQPGKYLDNRSYVFSAKKLGGAL